MVGLVVLAVVVLSALAVYADARRLKIGKTGQGGLGDMSPVGWAAATLFLWVVAFPYYLVKRNALKEAALANPKEPARAARDLVFLLPMTFAAIGLAGQFGLPAKLPKCTGADAVALANQTVKATIAERKLPIQFKMLNDFKEIQHNDTARTCSCAFVTDKGAEVMNFSLTWLDKDAGKFQLRILPPPAKN